MAYTLSPNRASQALPGAGLSLLRRVAGFATLFGLFVLMVAHFVHMWASRSADRAGVDAIAQMVSGNASVAAVVAVVSMFSIGMVRGFRSTRTSDDSNLS